jgi:hypothetical protein
VKAAKQAENQRVVLQGRVTALRLKAFKLVLKDARLPVRAKSPDALNCTE